MLELPLKPLLHIAFVTGSCFIFVITFQFYFVLVRLHGSSFAVFIWLCAFGKTANVLPKALAILIQIL
jgi:hypothetical protein